MHPGYADARAVVRRRDPALHWATRRLPAELRPAVYALLAYVRIADDIVRDARRPGRTLALDHWERELEHPTHPVAVALTVAAARHRIRLDFGPRFDALRAECEPLRPVSWEVLDAHTDATAGTVGRTLGALFDLHPDHVRDYGRLATAFRLTSLVRDAEAPHLPLDDPEDETALRTAAREGAARARARFVTCGSAVEATPPEIRRGVRMALAVAEHTLDRIDAAEGDVRRAAPPRWRSAVVALRSS